MLVMCCWTYSARQTGWNAGNFLLALILSKNNLLDIHLIPSREQESCRVFAMPYHCLNVQLCHVLSFSMQTSPGFTLELPVQIISFCCSQLESPPALQLNCFATSGANQQKLFISQKSMSCWFPTHSALPFQGNKLSFSLSNFHWLSGAR